MPPQITDLACTGFRSLAEPVEQAVHVFFIGIALIDDIEVLAQGLVEQPRLPPVDFATIEQRLKRVDRV